MLKWLERKHRYPNSTGAPVLCETLDMNRLLAHDKGLQLKQLGEGTSTVLRTYKSLEVGNERAVNSHTDCAALSSVDNMVWKYAWEDTQRLMWLGTPV